MDKQLRYAPEVEQALAQGTPLVALESTLITHGLPYPINVETALAMEHAIRAEGAVPATIAILKGEITVGLSAEQIEMLGQAENVRKCSRRDIPIAVGLKEDAATTVAGTMIVAHMAGIHLFATGGIGGVHRGQPFDTSADLIELGRTPVAVVCSGAKSILDLPLTLEVLETQGVPVIGYGTQDFPAFYTPTSGLPVDVCISTPQEAAQIIQSAQRLDVQNGIIIAVPIPIEAALNVDMMESAIQQATYDAAAQHIHGKAVTPFILSRVAALTDGASTKANQVLLVNNARIAGKIAKCL